MNQMPLWGDGKPARNAACNVVTDNEKLAWHALHDRELAVFLDQQGGQPFLPEDFRRWFLERGNEGPHHPNVWGAMWLQRANAGWVEKTGGFRQMACRTSHARLTSEWRKAQ